MTTTDPRLPGQGPKPETWATTAPARSWTELVNTVHGGLAVLDNSWRVVFVNDRFLSALAPSAAFTGLALQDVLPALEEDDPRHLKQKLAEGERIEFEQQFIDVDGERHWFHVTIVTSADLGGDLAAVVFATDITATSNKIAQLRDATVSLTEVETERQRQLRRDVHDGPIQLLAALMFRLGMSDTDEAKNLQHLVSEAARALRHVIEEFSPEVEGGGGPILERWIAPLLDGTGMSVTIQDERASDSGLAEAQAAFVLLYQAARAVRDPSLPRSITVELRDEQGGDRITLTTPSGLPAEFAGGQATRFRATTDHARSLGGTLTQSLDQNNLRTFSMWIPRLTHPTGPARVVAPELEVSRQHSASSDAALLAPLSDVAWRALVGEAPERMLEFDRHMSVTFANAEMSRSVDSTPDEMIGVPGDSMLTVGTVPDLNGMTNQLEAGNLVRTYWDRPDARGDIRQIHLAMSPRLDEDGAWAGLFAAMDDRTDIRLLDDLNQAALADLTLARHLAIESSIQDLEQPLSQCDELVDLIEVFERSSTEPGAIDTIRVALTDSLEQIRTASSAFTHPSLTTEGLDGALRVSLETLLEDRELVVIDDTVTSLAPHIVEVIFRIAREAVNNAVLHGKADVITMRLSNADGDVSCTIHDDGSGVDDDQLRQQPGHLGTRAMRERAREWGGTCHIGQHPVVGTLVSLWLPERSKPQARSRGFAPRP